MLRTGAEIRKPAKKTNFRCDRPMNSHRAGVVVDDDVGHVCRPLVALRVALVITNRSKGTHGRVAKEARRRHGKGQTVIHTGPA